MKQIQSLISKKESIYITSHGKGNIFIFAEIFLLKIPSCSVANYKVNY
jgi:hypothetical protein